MTCSVTVLNLYQALSEMLVTNVKCQCQSVIGGGCKKTISLLLLFQKLQFVLPRVVPHPSWVKCVYSNYKRIDIYIYGSVYFPCKCLDVTREELMNLCENTTHAIRAKSKSPHVTKK